MPFRCIVAVCAFGALLATSACAQREYLVGKTKAVIGRYCQADELERQVLRSQFVTPHGPLIEIHCENLQVAGI
ncbi:hypothetical protein [Marinivivus vitaminiproducens]|uniref:hypothetical protein n=1 Tax=Marinivivus vitaminiproducens TaxID=3035935 RepID=UPI0027A13B0D|nr:hypothetical protein P4R82_14365 [Geminicoccaceae bacterium SCSIO 64248]